MLSIPCFADGDQSPDLPLTTGYVDRDDSSTYTFVDFISDSISPFSLSSTMPSHTFNLPSLYDTVSWRWNQNQSMVTSASEFSAVMWNRLDDGDKTLMGAVANISEGLNRRIDANAISVSLLDQWINTKSASEISSGVDHTGITVPNLLSVIANNQKSIYGLKNTVRGAYAFGNYTPFFNVSLPDLIALNSQNTFQTADRLRAINEGKLISSTPVSIIGSDGVIDTSTVNFADMIAIISQNQGAAFRFLNDWLLVPKGNDILYKDGTVMASNDYDLSQVTAFGFLGLSQNLAGESKVITFTNTDPSNPLNPDSGGDTFSSLFDFLGVWGSSMQRELTKLRYVLASDDDIQMKQDEQPNEDAVKDEFFGDGPGSVNPSDITDAAGISGDAQAAFSGAGSVGDPFVAINDTQSYSFFSQEVSDSLDTVNSSVAFSSDDWMSNYTVDDDGFYTLYDISLFDVRKFLEGD